MFLSEAETEARLDELRRQRAALDRTIAEHELYLDLGRRLARPGAVEPAGPAAAPVQATRPDPAPRSEPASAAPVRAEPAAVPVPHPMPEPMLHPVPVPVPVPAPVRPDPAEPGPAPEAGPPGAAARREGRRLIEAAEAILAEAGRPMHAAEIWEQLAARGLTLPGHDPVAALNTRLWKRAQGGGVFRRLGDAVYGLAS